MLAHSRSLLLDRTMPDFIPATPSRSSLATASMPDHLSRRRLLTWLALASAASLSGCAALAGNLKAPNVQVRNLSFGRFDLMGLEIMVDLHVQNPNNMALPLTGIDYGISLQGVKVAEGSQAKAVTLPALGDTDVQLGLNVNLLSSATQLLPLFMNRRNAPKALKYSVEGSVKLDWWYMPSIPFNRVGEVPLTTR